MDLLREGKDLFRATYGVAETEGIDDLIDTDWESEDHLDYGNATEDEWKVRTVSFARS